MKEDGTSICLLVKPVLERVVLSLADKYRVRIHKLSPTQLTGLMALVQEAMKDKQLLDSVDEHVAKAVGLGESLVEINLHKVVNHAMAKFIKFTTSQ